MEQFGACSRFSECGTKHRTRIDGDGPALDGICLFRSATPLSGVQNAVLPADGLGSDDDPFLLRGYTVVHNPGCEVRLPDDGKAGHARAAVDLFYSTGCAGTSFDRSIGHAVV